MLKNKEIKREDKYMDVNAAMQGTLVFSDPVNLRINGKFDGNLTTKGNLIIGPSAVVSADVNGDSIIISGRVSGKICAANSITLTATAEVNGDIETPKLKVEDGAFFNGNCVMRINNKMSLAEVSEYLSIDEKKILEWVNSGKIPVEKQANTFLFDRREVEIWINTNV